MAAIEWSRLSSGMFEDMVACLLSHQNPDIQRIDGSGGDGGRDCQFDGPDGLHAYEMKGFPGGRVGKVQRRQVVRSLNKAALLKPVDWTLITPVDQTPAEKKWFDALRNTVPFPIVWRGKTWLDLEFAQRPFIAGYYLGTTSDEVVELLRELNKEEAALAGGMPDAIIRVEALVKRANTLDPHYRFKITSDAKTTSVAVIPAYVGAQIDRPITVSGQFRFDTKTELGRAKQEEFERALDFGSPAELTGDFVPEMSVDAPAGLGGTYKAPTITIGPGKPVRTEPLNLVFSILDPERGTVAALALNCIPQTSGRRGTVLHGSDRGGHVAADVTIDVTGRKFRVNLTVKWETFVPHDFVPVARFLAAYHAPNRVVVAQPDGTGASEPLECGPGFEMPGWLVEFVTNLAVIQASSGIIREVGQIAPQDVANVAGGAALLRGMEVPFPWTSGTVTVRTSASLATRKQMAENTVRVERVVDSPFVLNVCGTLYPIGHRYLARTAARVDPEDVDALVTEDLSGDLRVTLLPGPDEPLALIRLVE